MTTKTTLAGTGDQTGVRPEAMRTWIGQTEIDGGIRPGATTDDATRVAELEHEVRELRRANETLKTSAAFLGAMELDRKIKERCPLPVVIGYIDSTANGLGASESAPPYRTPVCRSPRAYCAAKTRPTSAQAFTALCNLTSRVYDNRKRAKGESTAPDSIGTP